MKFAILVLFVCYGATIDGRHVTKDSAPEVTEKIEKEKEVADAFIPGANNAYNLIGCFKDDHWTRAFYDNAKRFHRDSVQSCADYAKRLGNSLFALQDGSECWTSGVNTAKYALYGESDKCNNDKGGPYANSVYQLGPLNRNTKWLSIGCYKDTGSRAFKGAKTNLNGDNIIEQCRDLAANRQHAYFGLESGFFTTQCYTGNDLDWHLRFDPKRGCANGRGGSWRLNIYKVQYPVVGQLVQPLTVYHDEEDEE